MPSRRNTNLLIVGFLLFQLIYPIRGLVKNKFDTWGEFTWNMYSQTYVCTTRYQLADRSGARHEVNLRPYFAVPDKIGRVFNRQDLPTFHKFLCEELAREGRQGQILARVSCTKNQVQTERLVRENEDICTAPNHAVVD